MPKGRSPTRSSKNEPLQVVLAWRAVLLVIPDDMNCHSGLARELERRLCVGCRRADLLAKGKTVFVVVMWA